MAKDLNDPPPERPELPQPGAPPPPAAELDRPPPATPEPEPQGRRRLRRPTVRAPQADRFRFVLGALVGLGMAFGALAVYLIGQGPSQESKWSDWRPKSQGAKGAQEIAKRIAPTYKLPEGGQLVAIRGGSLKIADLDVNIAVRKPRDISVLEGRGVLYTLCGLGPRCSIDTGKPTPERHLLLQREALELALYSFHDLRGIDNVVVLLPPRKGSPPRQAMLFRKNSLEPQLETPLRLTLDSPPPTPATLLDSPEADQISRLTTPSLFSFKIEQGQDASAFLVLDPLKP